MWRFGLILCALGFLSPGLGLPAPDEAKRTPRFEVLPHPLQSQLLQLPTALHGNQDFGVGASYPALPNIPYYHQYYAPYYPPLLPPLPYFGPMMEKSNVENIYGPIPHQEITPTLNRGTVPKKPAHHKFKKLVWVEKLKTPPKSVEPWKRIIHGTDDGESALNPIRNAHSRRDHSGKEDDGASYMEHDSVSSGGSYEESKEVRNKTRINSTPRIVLAKIAIESKQKSEADTDGPGKSTENSKSKSHGDRSEGSSEKYGSGSDESRSSEDDSSNGTSSSRQDGSKLKELSDGRSNNVSPSISKSVSKNGQTESDQSRKEESSSNYLDSSASSDGSGSRRDSEEAKFASVGNARMGFAILPYLKTNSSINNVKTTQNQTRLTNSNQKQAAQPHGKINEVSESGETVSYQSSENSDEADSSEESEEAETPNVVKTPKAKVAQAHINYGVGKIEHTDQSSEGSSSGSDSDSSAQSDETSISSGESGSSEESEETETPKAVNKPKAPAAQANINKEVSKIEPTDQSSEGSSSISDSVSSAQRDETSVSSNQSGSSEDSEEAIIHTTPRNTLLTSQQNKKEESIRPIHLKTDATPKKSSIMKQPSLIMWITAQMKKDILGKAVLSDFLPLAEEIILKVEDFFSRVAVAWGQLNNEPAIPGKEEIRILAVLRNIFLGKVETYSKHHHLFIGPSTF